MSHDYDMAVIGSGPGGYAAALAARRRGLRTALIERGDWGGVCLNVGCIPTKALMAVAHTLGRIRQADRLGIRVNGVQLDYPLVLARNRRIIEGLRQGVVDLLRHHQVALIPGEAVFEDANSVRLRHEGQTRTLSAERFVVATGARPQPGPWAFDGDRLLSYRELLALASLPASLLIIGGGVIGCEFASCFAAFGVPVTLIEQQPHVLPTEDGEAVRVLSRILQARGVSVLTGASVESLTSSAEGVRASISSGQALSAERCLIAVGIQPNSEDLGLESLGVRTRDGVEVNERLLTSQPHIAAIGDCLKGHGLAHLASYEGGLAVANLLGDSSAMLASHLVPRCAYTDPELAQVGVLEAQVTDAYRVSRFPFAALGKSLCDEEPEGFVKLIADAATDRLLGATIVGAQASSLIHLAVMALHQGLTAKQLSRTMTAHPTLPEALSEAAAQLYGEALYSIGKARVKQSIVDSR